MLIEQNIDFELRGPVLLGRTKWFKTWYVHDKIKIYANLQVNFNLQVKILQRTTHLVSLKIFQEAMYFTKSNPNCKILTKVLDLTCK